MTNTTETDQIRPPEVTDKQSIAIDALVSGATHQEAAAISGVSRTTVTGWVNHNITFIAELNRRRRQRAEASGSLLRESLSKALDLIRQQIDEGDVDLALALLRIVGVEHLLAASRAGPTSNAAVTADLASRLDIDMSHEMMARPETVFFVEDRSDLANGEGH